MLQTTSPAVRPILDTLCAAIARASPLMRGATAADTDCPGRCASRAAASFAVLIACAFGQAFASDPVAGPVAKRGTLDELPVVAQDAAALDDRGLAGVHGKGSESAALAAGAAVAVILWDEKRCCAPQRGSAVPASAGRQGGSVTLRIGDGGTR